MDVKTWTYLIVGITFALYIGIAIWSRAKSTSEFYVAGGGVSPLANGMATAADWMSAASFISMAGLIAYSGYGGSVFLMGWTGGYVLLALLLAPYLRKYGKFTVPEFIGERFYSKTARVVAVACLIIISVTYVIGQMKGVGGGSAGDGAKKVPVKKKVWWQHRPIIMGSVGKRLLSIKPADLAGALAAARSQKKHALPTPSLRLLHPSPGDHQCTFYFPHTIPGSHPHHAP